MNHADELRSLLLRDGERLRILRCVYSLHLPDCWIGAGFLRNAVWDYLHGRPPSSPDGDIDVIWFDPVHAQPTEDQTLERRLTALEPGVRWSVRNQSMMHVRNDDAPYTSAVHALRFWPETATTVAVRWTSQSTVKIAAPFGLDDLFNLIIRSTPRFITTKRDIYLDRVRTKQWLRIWPHLTLADAGDRHIMGAA